MDKNSLTLSIVIPVYNEEDHLAVCLDAIARQTVPADEVIIVDNNSTDKSRTVAKKYPFVKLLSAKPQGVIFARNIGFDNVKSDLIGRIDADTVLPTDWVKRVKEFYQKSDNKNVAITGGAIFRNMPLPRVTSWLQKQLAFRLDRLALGHHMLWGSNTVLPRSVWKQVRSNVCARTDIHEDIDLAIHLHLHGHKILYKPELKVGAVLRRVVTNHEALYQDLLRWPRTLRCHHKRGWVLIVIGAAVVYLLACPARALHRVQSFFDIS